MDASIAPESMPRKLIYFPIVHNQADMGALSELVKKASLRKVGRQSWKRKLDLIEKFWDEIEQAIGDLSLKFDRVRIYQDGLPVSCKEADIVRDLARSGSRNHALLLRLMDRGARLTGTESLELLLEEYEMVKRGLESRDLSGKVAHGSSAGNSLLQRRDKFIAKRIDETLAPGEVGVVFLGMLHRLEQWLADDIQVIYPLYRPVGG